MSSAFYVIALVQKQHRGENPHHCCNDGNGGEVDQKPARAMSGMVR